VRKRITPLENLKLAAGGDRPRWMPFTLDIGAIPGLTEPVLREFEEKTGSEDPAEYFDFDFRTFSLQARGGAGDPARYHGDVPPGTEFDEWGIGHWAGGAEATYEKMLSPLARALAVGEVEAYPEPFLDEVQDRSAIEGYHRRGYPVFGYAGSVYEWSWWLRGMQRFMEDTILHPEIALALTAKVAGYVEHLALESAAAGIDVLCFYDDVGMQTGMQISPEAWRRFVKPRWSRILRKVRESHPGAIFFLHSCGNITDIVADIVEIGFHILHPLQPECMELAPVRERYGQRILPCGTVSAQRLFPFGGPEEIRREVHRLKELCAEDNRLLLCPSNMIQPETPWENIVAFVEEARKGRPSR
jgi:uroporphyrinogen decarboxylase